MTRGTPATIHLSGPLAGCNESQRTRWRAEFARLCHGFECIDPSEWGADWDFSRDMDAVDRCDVLVANMWKESIGTTLEIMHAHSRGKPVVLIDPNFLDHPILAGLVAPEVPVRTVAEAAQRVKALVAALGTFPLEKRDGSMEPFVRDKLLRAVKLACAESGVNDLEFPNQIVGAAVEVLRMTSAVRVVTTDDVRHEVFSALDALASPIGGRRPAATRVEAVKAVWHRREQHKSGDAFLDDLTEQKLRLEERVGELVREVSGLHRELAERDRRLRELERRPEPPPLAMPTTVVEAVRRLADEYADAVVVHPRALKSAKDSPYRDAERAWKALDLLGRYARARLEAATGVGQPYLGGSEWFRDHRDEAPWLTYKPHESQTSKTMWDVERTVEWEGEQLRIDQHLCVGKGSAADLLRIHFAVHQRTGVVVLGHCGKHLPNTLS